jgi:hypothetical protein
MDEDAAGLLEGLLFTARLTQADTPSNFFVDAPNPRSRGAHIALRHEVTERLAKRPEQFTALSTSQLRALDTYFAFAEQPDVWGPLAIERKRPEIVSHALTALKEVDRGWYLSLFKGHLSLGGTCDKTAAPALWSWTTALTRPA